MARGPKRKSSSTPPTDDGDDEAEKSTSKADIPPTLKMWFEEAWHGWMKPVGSIVLLIAAYFAYDRNVIPEGSAGLIVVALIIGGTISSVAYPGFELLTKRQQKLMLGAFVAVWSVSAAYAPLRRAFPARAIGEPTVIANCARWKEADHKDCADPKLSATVAMPEGSGPFEIDVSGELKGTAEAESNYHLIFTGADGSKEEVEGILKRTYVHQRTSRKGTGSTTQRQERTENTHRIAVHGASVKIEADGVDDALENGLIVSFHSAGPDPRLFLILGVLCILVGLYLDFWFAAPKVKTYFTMGTGITFAFAAYYPLEATPHFLVRPAIAALVFAVITGGLAGWLIAVIVKSFKTKPKKMIK